MYSWHLKSGRCQENVAYATHLTAASFTTVECAQLGTMQTYIRVLVSAGAIMSAAPTQKSAN